MTSQKKFGPIFACFYPFFHVKLRAQVQDLQKREFYDLPEHGTATTKARGGLGTIQTSWARRAIKIMAVDSCVHRTIWEIGVCWFLRSNQFYVQSYLGGIRHMFKKSHQVMSKASLKDVLVCVFNRLGSLIAGQ